mmetsp:Transcript_31991/g.83823  ORF Transcript_31991/g.83823 Transcript_31991/m.83823 type:complete len:269 (-) Transcript_31991:808-1614(-)
MMKVIQPHHSVKNAARSTEAREYCSIRSSYMVPGLRSSHCFTPEVPLSRSLSLWRERTSLLPSCTFSSRFLVSSTRVGASTFTCSAKNSQKFAQRFSCLATESKYAPRVAAATSVLNSICWRSLFSRDNAWYSQNRTDFRAFSSAMSAFSSPNAPRTPLPLTAILHRTNSQTLSKSFASTNAPTLGSPSTVESLPVSDNRAPFFAAVDTILPYLLKTRRRRFLSPNAAHSLSVSSSIIPLHVPLDVCTSSANTATMWFSAGLFVGGAR